MLKKLQFGDTVGLICPSFKCDLNSERITKLETEFKKLGIKLKYGKNAGKENGYLAGTDEERVQDLHEMFLDKDVKMIMCLKGGYGASRIVDKIDFNIIKNNPKLFIGFSDITVLLNSIYQKTGLITIHGLVGIFLGHPRIDEFSLKDFNDLLFTNQSGRILKNFNDDSLALIKGESIGNLVGGNLTLIINLIGTDYDIDFKDKIVFIEEVEEEPYRIDRMFAQLRLSGKLKEAKGFILGQFTDCNPSKPDTQTYLDLIKEYFGDLKVPVLYNFNSGHDFPFINLPIGAKVKLDSNNKKIEILEEIYK